MEKTSDVAVMAILAKKIDGNAVSKKKSRPQFLEFLKILASDPRKLYFLGSDARIFENSKNCGRDFFFGHLLFAVTLSILPACSDFEQQ